VILAVGEALVEVMRPRPVPLDRPGELAGPFASGAPAIYASVAARLGGETALAAVVGDDPFGALIRRRLVGDGVDVSRLRADPEHATGCAFVTYDEAGGRTFVFHMGAAAGLAGPDLGDLPERADWLHVSGSTLALSPAMAAVAEHAAERVHAAGGRIGFDPNLRSGVPTAAARAIAAHALVLFPSEGEAAGLDAPVVCTTLGPRGVRIRAGGREEIVPAPHVGERDPTGAGDTFAAAFTVATLAGADPIEAARAATPVAAAAVEELGPAEAPVERFWTL
jgi:sugar/nucleoside kinase (ribokinase family)